MRFIIEHTELDGNCYITISLCSIEVNRVNTSDPNNIPINFIGDPYYAVDTIHIGLTKLIDCYESNRLYRCEYYHALGKVSYEIRFDLHHIVNILKTATTNVETNYEGRHKSKILDVLNRYSNNIN